MTYEIVSPGVHGGPGDGHGAAEGAAPAELRGAADTRGLHRRRVLLRGHVGQVGRAALYTRVTCPPHYPPSLLGAVQQLSDQLRPSGS